MYELLRMLSQNEASTNNWPGRIRHFVRASAPYQDLKQFTGKENADLEYFDDQDCVLEKRIAQGGLGDDFEEWWLGWLNDRDVTDADPDPVKWLFEVKNNIGSM